MREEEDDMKVRSGVQHQVTQQGKQSCHKEISEDKLDQIMEEINNLKQQMAYQRQPWRDRRRFDKKGSQQNQQPQKQSPSTAEPDTTLRRSRKTRRRLRRGADREQTPTKPQLISCVLIDL